MVDVKISQLTNASSFVSTDLFEISQDQGGGSFASRSLSGSDLKSSVLVGQNVGITTKTTNYTAGLNDDVILCDASGGSFTIDLPAASGVSGKVYYIKKILGSPSNAVTIDGNGSETIDGSTTIDISVQYQSLTIICDGSSWFII